jgi:hypothetical protein
MEEEIINGVGVFKIREKTKVNKISKRLNSEPVQNCFEKKITRTHTVSLQGLKSHAYLILQSHALQGI